MLGVIFLILAIVMIGSGIYLYIKEREDTAVFVPTFSIAFVFIILSILPASKTVCTGMPHITNVYTTEQRQTFIIGKEIYRFDQAKYFTNLENLAYCREYNMYGYEIEKKVVHIQDLTDETIINSRNYLELNKE